MTFIDRFEKIASEMEEDFNCGKTPTREDAYFLCGVVHPNSPADEETKREARRLMRKCPGWYFRGRNERKSNRRLFNHQG